MEAMLEGICPAAMVEKLWQCGDSLLLLRHGMQGQVLGAVSYRQLESRELYDRLGSLELSGYVRQKAGGRALLISGLWVPDGNQQRELGQLLLTEVFTMAQRAGVSLRPV